MRSMFSLLACALLLSGCGGQSNDEPVTLSGIWTDSPDFPLRQGSSLFEFKGDSTMVIYTAQKLDDCDTFWTTYETKWFLVYEAGENILCTVSETGRESCDPIAGVTDSTFIRMNLGPDTGHEWGRYPDGYMDGRMKDEEKYSQELEMVANCDLYKVGIEGLPAWIDKEWPKYKDVAYITSGHELLAEIGTLIELLLEESGNGAIDHSCLGEYQSLWDSEATNAVLFSPADGGSGNRLTVLIGKVEAYFKMCTELGPHYLSGNVFESSDLDKDAILEQGGEAIFWLKDLPNVSNNLGAIKGLCAAYSRLSGFMMEALKFEPLMADLRKEM